VADVFISYSGKDAALVRRLHAALIERQRHTWVDWEGIPFSAEWMKEIEAGIDAAEAFVFILSPNSIQSDVCAKELAHAVARNKRIVPVLARDAAGASVPEALARLQWIPLRSEEDFEHGIESLVRTLDTDLEWTRAHTRLLVRAQEWLARAQDRSRLLRGQDLKDAERWLLAATGAERRPTDLHAQFIAVSRQSAQRLRRVTLTAVSVALIVAAVLALVAWQQRFEAVRQRDDATSRELAASAVVALDTDPERSIRLALEAVSSKPTREAEQALRAAVQASRVRLVLPVPEGASRIVAFNADGIRLTTAGADRRLIAWDAVTGAVASTTVASHRDSRAWHPQALSGDGKHLASAAPDGVVVLADLDSGAMRTLAGHDGAIHEITFSGDGRYLATAGEDRTARLWDVR
jgi:hypothetical protein